LPETAYIDVTNGCPARCPFCFAYRYYREGKHRILSLEEFEYITVKLLDLGVRNFFLIGGEPTILSPDLLYSMVSLAYDYGVDRVMMETNAYMLHMHGKTLGLLYYVYASLDYFDQRHDIMRGIKVTDLIKEYVKSLDNFGLTSVFLVNNLDDIVRMMDLCAKYEKKYTVKTLKPDYSEVYLVDGGQVKKVYMSGRNVARHILKLYRTVLAFNEERGTSFKIQDEPGFYVYALERGYHAIPLCGAGTHIVAVKVDGSIYGCPYATPDYMYLGNIFKNTTGYISLSWQLYS